MQRLTIKRPDDFHLHLRDDALLSAVVGASSRDFARALIMPNLVPPVVTGSQAAAYRERIELANGSQGQFEPLMTLYLTEDTDPSDVVAAHAEGLIHAVKLYPAGATTNSQSGVRSIENVLPVLEAMSDAGLVLCIHGEVTDSSVDIFDREAAFIERVLHPLRERLPALRIVLEHVTTAVGVDYIESSSANLAGTITPHHLMINRNHMLSGGIRPHYYCLPILKRESHREALVAAATSGDRRFFLGTDSAPHRISDKHSECGCAGVFNAPVTLSCLATLFEAHDALSRLEGFVAVHGADYYRLPQNEGTVTLEKREQALALPPDLPVGDDAVRVFDPGQPLFWHVLPD